MKNITIYSNAPLKIDDKNQLYKVQKGSVNIFALTNDGKKEFVTTIKEGEIFFSLEIFKNKNLRLELFAGSIEPTIYMIDYKKNDYEKMKQSLDKFYNYIKYEEQKLKEIEDANRLFLYLKILFEELPQNIINFKKQKEKQELARLNNSIASDNTLVKKSILNLASIFDKSFEEFEVEIEDNILFETIKRVCGKLGIFVSDIDLKYIDPQNPVLSISKALNIKNRPVKLSKDWYTQDSGALLGFTSTRVPVALLPINTKSYMLVNLQTNQKTKVNQKIASTLLDIAYMFYRPLSEKKIKFKDIFKFVYFGNKKDLMTVRILGIFGGLIALVNPLIIGKLFDDIIPQAGKSRLIQMGIALGVAAFSVALFDLVRGISIARMRSRISLNLQSAIWDRLINLPTSFFKRYSVGDLAVRANGINQIQEVLSGATLSAFISGMFSIFSLFLLFKYSLKLALVGLLLVFIAIVFNIISTLVQLKYLKKIINISGEISGFLFEIISGIQKLKIANATNRAFVKWVDKFYIQRDLSYRSGYLQNYLEVFNVIFPLVVSIVIFSFVAFSMKEDKQFSIGEFIAFNAAFSQFLVAALTLSQIFMSILNIKPIYERLKPILEEIPEIQLNKKNPGIIKGDIEIRNLSFKYKPESKYILSKINMDIKQGEFVAVVGSSGSGKSTLLRLLLGFEFAQEGNIFYDNQNLHDIDIQALRAQLGVVLQNGRLIGGDIYTNIIGSTNKTIDDAWIAAKRAGFEEDIKQMPMGIHTMVSDGGGTLSGGQKQRLLIARALINNPKIIYFDEATSALDNKTQEIVTKSLDKLDATRVVIAHRLSTIINADKIYVLDQGRVSQEGTYEELLKEEGIFKKLASRQIV